MNSFGNEEHVYSLSFQPECHRQVFASACLRGQLLLYDEQCSYRPVELMKNRRPFTSVCFNPVDDRILASANINDGLEIWDIRNSQKYIFHSQLKNKIRPFSSNVILFAGH